MDAKEINRLYWTENKTLREIAAIAGVSIPAIRMKMKTHGIARRSNSAAQRLKNCSALDDETLASLYQDGLSQNKIAEQFGITQSAVKNRMKKAGIPRRSRANHGEANGMYGRNHSPATIEKIRIANQKQFSQPGARKAAAIRTCEQIQKGQTGKAFNRLEQRVAEILDNQGSAYIQQYRVGRYLFDFYLPTQNVLIEVHGTFWHADPRFYDHALLSPIQKRNVSNDMRKAARALKEGFRLVVLWEHDVMLGNVLLDL